MHLAGASAVQVGTALLRGFGVFEEIKKGVDNYLDTNGFSDVSEIIGIAGRTVK